MILIINEYLNLYSLSLSLSLSLFKYICLSV